jgi:chromosome segregation ATPase
MAGKRNDKVTDLTVMVLREIRDEVRELRGEAKETNARLDQTNARLEGLTQRVDGLQVEMRQGFSALRAEMHQGFELLGNRIDNVLLGEHRQEHEELRGRVERIEQHLGLEPQ